MRASWLVATVGSLLVLGVIYALSPGEPAAEELVAALEAPAEADLASAPTEGGSGEHGGPLGVDLAALFGYDVMMPDEAVGSVATAPSWMQRLVSIDGWLEAMGVGLNATERMQRQLEAVRAAHDQPFDPAPWGDAPQRTGDKSPPSVTAAAAVVLDEASMTVLYGKNERVRLPPASTTKIATLILALEHGGLDEVVENTVDSRQMPGSSLMGLLPGDSFTLRELLYGLMLPSGNDAALAVGRHVSGSDEAFMDDIDRLLQRLRLENTKFIDPHGLGRGGGHYSTALDMALLARYGMQMPEFVEIVSTPAIRVNGSRRIDLRNTNQFLTRYSGADGVKTGFTYAGGPTFVGSAVRDGRRLYVVLLNSQDRPGEAAKLLDWAFENYEWSAAPEPDEARGDERVLEATSSR